MKRQELLEEYEELYGSIEGKDYTQLPFYQEYVVKFKVDPGLKKRLIGHEGVLTMSDTVLFLQLTVASFSPTYVFEHLDKLDQERFKITCDDDDSSTTKKLDELWVLQIYRLFQIYMEEQMQLAIDMKESEFRDEAIKKERARRLKIYQNELDALKKERALAKKRLAIMDKLEKLTITV
jgi:hypothetical protein